MVIIFIIVINSYNYIISLQQYAEAIVMIILVKIETNLKMYVRVPRHSLQIYLLNKKLICM